MKPKRAVFLWIFALLTVSILSGCPPKVPPIDDDYPAPPALMLTAKEAWDMINPVRNTFSDNVVPIYIGGSGGYKLPITEGKCPSWNAYLYSDQSNAVWDFGFTAYYYEGGPMPTPDSGERVCGHVALEAYDLDYWYIDSPEACATAARNGAGKTTGMSLQAAADMDLLKGEYFSFNKNPEFVPDATELLWVIADENSDYYYVDAHTGEYLGSCSPGYFVPAPAPPPKPDAEAPAGSPLYLDSDAHGELCRRYGAGADIGVSCTIHSALDADEYMVTYSYNGITPDSPDRYLTEDPSGSFALRFSPPGDGNGRIIIKLTAYSGGEAIGEARSYLYLSSCSQGTFLSAYSEPLAELAAAKARFDAFDIASMDYYEIVRDNFMIDPDLLEKLRKNASHEIERYGYAERYVEAVNDYIFGIEPDE